MLDLTGEFGQRVARRLAEERIIWLTTIDGAGMPQPRPVWFLWEEGTFLIYSQPNTHKLRHLGRNPKVALNLDGDGLGGDIVVISGEAGLDPNAPAANEVAAYVDKYQAGFKRIGMTPQTFADSYAIAIRVRPTSLRGH